MKNSMLESWIKRDAPRSRPCLLLMHTSIISMCLALIKNATTTFAVDKMMDSLLTLLERQVNGVNTNAIFLQRHCKQCSFISEMWSSQMSYSGLVTTPLMIYGKTLKKRSLVRPLTFLWWLRKFLDLAYQMLLLSQLMEITICSLQIIKTSQQVRTWQSSLAMVSSGRIWGGSPSKSNCSIRSTDFILRTFLLRIEKLILTPEL